MKKMLIILLSSMIPLTLALIGVLIYSFQAYDDRIYYDCHLLPPSKVAIVFGAGYNKDGKLSTILQDRLNTAVLLYNTQKVKKILLSGGNPTDEYDETKAMFEEAIHLGVPKKDLWRDFGGRSTYDTCFRAKKGWFADQAILVTQEYHLPRALYCANGLGIDAVGITADGSLEYRDIETYRIREIPAMLLNILDIHLFNTQPEVDIQPQAEAMEP